MEQPARDAAAERIGLAVRPGARRIDDRKSLRRACRRVQKCVVQQLVLRRWKRNGGRREDGAILHADERVVLDSRLGSRYGLLEQELKLLQRALDRLAIEDAFVVDQLEPQALSIVLGVERDVEAVHELRDGVLRYAQSRKLESPFRDVLHVEKYLEERALRRLAARRERFNDFFEGDVLVRVGLNRDLAHPVEQLDEGRVFREICTQRERVDEEPDHRLDLGPIAVRAGSADHDVAPAVQTGDQQAQRRQEHHERGRVARAAEEPDRGGQLGGEIEHAHPAAPSCARARPAGRERREFRGASQLLAPIGDRFRPPAGIALAALALGIVGILLRERFER